MKRAIGIVDVVDLTQEATSASSEGGPDSPIMIPTKEQPAIKRQRGLVEEEDEAAFFRLSSSFSADTLVVRCLCPECWGFCWHDYRAVANYPNCGKYYYLEERELEQSLRRLLTLFRASQGYDQQPPWTCQCWERGCRDLDESNKRAWAIRDKPRLITPEDMPLLNRIASATDDVLARMRTAHEEMQASWWRDDEGEMDWKDRVNLDKIYQLGAGNFMAGTDFVFGGEPEAL